LLHIQAAREQCPLAHEMCAASAFAFAETQETITKPWKAAAHE